MSDDPVAALRDRFDRSFAEPPAAPEPPAHSLLRVRVGGEPYAIALAEVASLHAGLDVVPVPSPAPELLGIAAVRSVLVAIYDLRIALGAPAVGAPRWVVLVRGAAAGFAFDHFEGHAHSRDEGTVVSIDGTPHALVTLGVVLRGIETRWAAGRTATATKEQR